MGIYNLVKKYIAEKARIFIPDNDIFTEFDAENKKIYIGFVDIEKSLQKRLGSGNIECYYGNIIFAVESDGKISNAFKLEGPFFLYPSDAEEHVYFQYLNKRIMDEGIKIDDGLLAKKLNELGESLESLVFSLV